MNDDGLETIQQVEKILNEKSKEWRVDSFLSSTVQRRSNDQVDESKLLEELEDRVLKPVPQFSLGWLDRLQKRWIEPPNYLSLLELAPTLSRTSFRFIRQGLDGKIVDYEEVTAPAKTQTAKNSTSFGRKPATKADMVRGRAGFFPFAPGGVDPEVKGDTADDTVEEMEGESRIGKDGLLQLPPGFSRGLRIETEEKADDELRQVEFSMDDIKPIRKKVTSNGQLKRDTIDYEEEEGVDNLLPVEFPLLAARGNLAPSSTRKKAKEWAHMVDINQELTNFHELVPNMAREYPFELDTFQKEAIYHLESGDSVFVAAHTSAGKTAVAEYAISLAAKHVTKAIYTSPIKALSNQKFRDFRQTFDDVGILTGDVQINPEASCLIMTTEILRSMLYRGADLIRDVEFVIFDEVHYVNDLERGVVWEEVIIMLPEHVNLVLLSATVPNTKEFANWVGRTKKQDIYVISTPKRPVPLEHFIWAKKNLFKIVDAGKTFLAKGYRDAETALSGKDSLAVARGDRGRGGRGQESRGRGNNVFRPRNTAPDPSLWNHMVQYLYKRDLLPVVIFVFSKRRCELYADMLSSIDYCNASEKSEVHIMIEKAVARLKLEDRQLPQIQRIRLLLSRGIAVHHGGMLPIVKEIVEILFARGLVKVLFATETFAMGLNLPARTVCFSGIRKHDGQSFRDLLPSEYTQMAGRAGRRGLDTTGTVIIVATGDQPPAVGSLNKMMLGNPGRLQSQFRLTYNMILNLARVEALKIEEMIKRSFSENASQILLPEHEQNVVASEANLAKMKKVDCTLCKQDIEELYEVCESYRGLLETMIGQALTTVQGKRILGQGRVVILREPDKPRTIGVILGEIRAFAGDQQPSLQVVLVQPASKQVKRSLGDLVPPLPMFLARDQASFPELLENSRLHSAVVPIQLIELVTNFIVKPDVLAIRKHNREAIAQLKQQLMEVMDRFPKDKSVEVDWSKIKNLDFTQVCQTKQTDEKSLDKFRCLECPHFNKHFAQFHEEYLLRQGIADLKQMLSDQNLELLPDYEGRVQVLKEMNFLDEYSTVQLKGRVACEINSAHELILTELILENFLAEYEPEEIVALLSCFVFQEKTDSEPTISPKLQKGKQKIINLAKRVNVVQERHQVLASSEDLDFEERPRFGLVEVVYEWARGMPFYQITDLTDVLEGTIVRVITRLDETCREVKSAAKIIGDASLFSKMQEAQDMIKRDLVFSTSLYF